MLFQKMVSHLAINTEEGCVRNLLIVENMISGGQKRNERREDGSRITSRTLVSGGYHAKWSSILLIHYSLTGNVCSFFPITMTPVVQGQIQQTSSSSSSSTSVGKTWVDVTSLKAVSFAWDEEAGDSLIGTRSESSSLLQPSDFL